MLRVCLCLFLFARSELAPNLYPNVGFWTSPATSTSALDLSPFSPRMITKSKHILFFFLFCFFWESLSITAHCKISFSQLHHGKLDRVQGLNKCAALFLFFFFFALGRLLDYSMLLLLFSYRAPATSVSLQTNLLSTKPRISSAQVIDLHSRHHTQTPTLCHWILSHNANLSPSSPCFSLFLSTHPLDVAHYYLFCSPNLPNPFQQVLTTCTKATICWHISTENHTMGNVLYWKMSFPLLDIRSLEHHQALIGSLKTRSL